MSFDPFNTELEALPPLWRALEDKNFVEARRLVREGAVLDDLLEHDGSSILHRAAENDCLVMVEFYLACGCPKTLESFDYIQRTPLICAAAEGCREIVKHLLAAGANPNAHDEARIGNTAVREAVRAGEVDIVRMLLRAGADPTIPGWMMISAVDQAHSEIRGGLNSRQAAAIQEMLAPWPSSLRNRAGKKNRRR